MLKVLGVSKMAGLLWEQICYLSISEMQDRAQGPIKLGGNTLQGAGTNMMTQSHSHRLTDGPNSTTHPHPHPAPQQGYLSSWQEHACLSPIFSDVIAQSHRALSVSRGLGPQASKKVRSSHRKLLNPV